METVLSSIPDIIQVASLIVAAAAIVASMTKTPKDDGIVKTVRKVVDFLAFNFGNARNQK